MVVAHRRAGKSKLDNGGVGIRGEYQIIFQLPLFAVINQVHTGIDLAVFNLGDVGQVTLPLAAVCTQKIMAHAEQWLQTLYSGSRVGAQQLHA